MRLVATQRQNCTDSSRATPCSRYAIVPFDCSLEDILNQPRLMTQRQVQVHRLHRTTMHDGETAVPVVVANALATTGPKVRSKHTPKISLEWGENKTMGPDFY
jgi:hypothetical protein